MDKTRFRILLIIIDLISALISWMLFFYLRKTFIEQTSFVISDSFYLGITIVPIFWLILYYIQGTYNDILKLHRIKILNLSFFASILGSLLLFFLLLLDDTINGYKMYYTSILTLFGVHFTTLFVLRLIIVNRLVRLVHKGKLGFNTILIGGSEKAVDIYNEITNLSQKSGYHFIGFVNINGIDRLLEDQLQYLGHVNDLDDILKNQEIEEVIIALESTEHAKLKNIISKLSQKKVRIQVLPDMYDILSGSLRMTNIFGALLLEVNQNKMPFWQQIVKRGIDMLFSFIAMILLIPVYITLMIAVKVSSKGPIFYLQERIGMNGLPFKIIKFRTMYVDAEKAGPQLSSSHDPRITKIGRFMRKTRLDEFPQFWNVLKGDMSLVGPRPERQFFIDQISPIEPQFLSLTAVRPGITSWGQVKYGYAENINEMIQRMKYDLLYLQNRSLALDFKIMLYTILIVFRGTGK